MSGGSQQQSSQVSSSEPWKPAQKHLDKIFKDARKIYKDGGAFDPYPGNWYVGPSAATNQAHAGITNIANQGNPLAQPGMDLSAGLMGGEYGPNTEGDYRGLLGRYNNEAFDSMLDTTVGKVGDEITRQFGGSAFGSGAHSGTLADQLGEVATRAKAQHFNEQFNRERGLLGDITNLGQMDVQNRLAGFGISSPAYQAQYAPYDRLAQVGAAQEGYDAAQLQGEMNQWNAQHQAPLNALNFYSGIVGGASAPYGSTTSTVSTPTNPWASALGGGLLGAQVGGPIGGLGGGLLGLLGGM